MAREMKSSDTLQAERSAELGRKPEDEALLDLSGPPPGGLLITADPALARAFRRELRRCGECALPIEVRSNFEKALQDAGGPYRWVSLDLDAAVAPREAVRLARRRWPAARVALLSCWWSERDRIARDLADLVIHKPLRSAELRALLRPSAAAR